MTGLPAFLVALAASAMLVRLPWTRAPRRTLM